MKPIANALWVMPLLAQWKSTYSGSTISGIPNTRHSSGVIRFSSECWKPKTISEMKKYWLAVSFLARLNRIDYLTIRAINNTASLFFVDVCVPTLINEVSVILTWGDGAWLDDLPWSPCRCSITDLILAAISVNARTTLVASLADVSIVFHIV